MKVYIAGGDSLIESMFKQRKFSIVDTAEESDIICFTGGEDVDPEYYGERPLPGTYFNTARDEWEESIFDNNKDKFFVGICRGGQFLNVLSGGKMYQDVDNHLGNHKIYTPEGKEICEVTSTHHQMMIPHPRARILAIAHESQERARQRGVFVGDHDDTEIIFYSEIKDSPAALCFQPHPEYKHKPTETVFFESLKIVSPKIKEFMEQE